MEQQLIFEQIVKVYALRMVRNWEGDTFRGKGKKGKTGIVNLVETHSLEHTIKAMESGADDIYRPSLKTSC